MIVRFNVAMTIFCLIAAFDSTAQAQKDPTPPKKESYPINAGVLDFAKKNLGNQVGNGECSRTTP